MTDVERVAKKRALVWLDRAVQVSVLIVLVGVVVLYLKGESRDHQQQVRQAATDQRLERLEGDVTTALGKLDLAARGITHLGTCSVLYSVYRAGLSEVVRPREVPSKYPPSGGLVPPSLDVLAANLSGCQDLLDPANLATPTLKETP